MPHVLILMGSDSDWPAMQPCHDKLRAFGFGVAVHVASAHRTPQKVEQHVREAEAAGAVCVIAAAGGAAHLAGVVAAHTYLPVIGVPLDSSPLQGLDALLATAQMPPGVPVAAMGVGAWGAQNAAILALQIAAVADPAWRAKVVAHKRELAEAVAKRDAALGAKLAAGS